VRWPGSPGRRTGRAATIAVAVSYWTARAVEFVMGLALVGVAVMVCLQVLFRFVLGAPLHYTEEVARYLTIWAALLGASLGVRSGTHFAVTYVLGSMPTGLRRAVAMGARLVLAAFLIAFGFFGTLLLETALVQSSPASRIPMVLVYVAVPVATVLMLTFMLTESVARDVLPLPSEVFEDEQA
jgi:TRAP-type C4-dicarboxylate transport system permease small subunit